MMRLNTRLIAEAMGSNTHQTVTLQDLDEIYTMDSKIPIRNLESALINFQESIGIRYSLAKGQIHKNIVALILQLAKDLDITISDTSVIDAAVAEFIHDNLKLVVDDNDDAVIVNFESKHWIEYFIRETIFQNLLGIQESDD